MDLLVEPQLQRSKKNFGFRLFPRERYVSLCYHDIFNFAMTAEEMKRFGVGKKVLKRFDFSRPRIISKVGKYFFLDGKMENVWRRGLNEKAVKEKMSLARKVGVVLRLIPTIVFVGITGSLAMKNSNPESDIDLMIITKKDSLWLTRLITYTALTFWGYNYRKYGNSEEKDKLCLNMWLTENNLEWDNENRNVFTAHEILAIAPLVNKKNIWEKFLKENEWYGEYWVNNLKPRNINYEKEKGLGKIVNEVISYLINLGDMVAYIAQSVYMMGKITNEKVERRRAIFHPVNLSCEITVRFKSYGYI